MSKIYISLGSNMGDRLATLSEALKLINNAQGVAVKQASQVYETEPVGFEEQDWFYNAVAELDVSLSPQELLTALMSIEAELGRVRMIHWGPRTIDLDILLFDNQVIDETNLQIPHPRMAERGFVLIPLGEIAPEAVVPNRGKIKDLLEDLGEDKNVTCISKKIW